MFNPIPSNSSFLAFHSPTAAMGDNSGHDMLYKGTALVVTAAVILFISNIIICWVCGGNRHQGRSSLRPGGPHGTTTGGEDSLRSFKYKKEKSNNMLSFQGLKGENECVVCLSVFEEGEEVRLLPKCRHSFHAPCIDMWLYSHYDCPLCRTPILVLPPLPPPPPSSHRQPAVVAALQYSQDGPLGQGVPIF